MNDEFQKMQRPNKEADVRTSDFMRKVAGGHEAPKYHSGGILGANEKPEILLSGEEYVLAVGEDKKQELPPLNVFCGIASYAIRALRIEIVFPGALVEGMQSLQYFELLASRIERGEVNVVFIPHNMATGWRLHVKRHVVFYGDALHTMQDCDDRAAIIAQAETRFIPIAPYQRQPF